MASVEQPSDNAAVLEPVGMSRKTSLCCTLSFLLMEFCASVNEQRLSDLEGRNMRPCLVVGRVVKG